MKHRINEWVNGRMNFLKSKENRKKKREKR